MTISEKKSEFFLICCQILKIINEWSLLNRVGCVVTWIAWVKFLCELRGLHCSKYFLRGSSFYVGCVGQTFLRGSKIFCVGLFVGQNFLRGSNNFCSGQFLGVSLKNISIGTFTIIS